MRLQLWEGDGLVNRPSPPERKGDEMEDIELAEKMAEFIGLDRDEDSGYCWINNHWMLPKSFMFSPDGFFAVKLKVFRMGYPVYRVWPEWDQAHGEGLKVLISEDNMSAQVFEGHYYYPKDKPLDHTEAEITAFYEAVHKMINQRSMEG